MKNKIRLPTALARLAGSKDDCVEWRAWSFQLGILVFLVSQVIMIWREIANFQTIGVFISILFILGIQWLLRKLYRTSNID
jgi:uncharacterized membrane protein YgdD (TMEM256/DUF423 family)